MSLGRLRDWSMRTKLVVLLAIPLGGLLVFVAAAYRALTQLRVNGPVYQRLAAADELIADVLPPPEYVIEAYLTLFQQLDQAGRATSAGDLIDKTRRLEQTFEARRQFWSDTLPPGALRAALLDGAAREARAFFDLERSQFLPALGRGDLAAARAVAYGPLAQTYERHRRAVDQVVDLARQAKLAEERAAEAKIWAWSAAMIGVGVLTFLLTALGGLLVATAIARPVGRLDLAITEQAQGQPFQPLAPEGNDELGRLIRSFNEMAGAIEARNAALRRSNAELKQANQELEGFSYSVSHDLRTPLRAILGFSASLVEDFGGVLPEEARRCLTVIDNSARRMADLIADLLAFARHARQPIQREELALEPLVRACVDDLTAERAGRHIDLRVDSLPNCRADPALMRVVFANLIGNAIKFTRRRDPAVIEVGSLTQGGQTVYFVRDNGEGFDMRYHDKVFAVFQRLHAQDDYEGTGVGLALVQRIVARHGGRIWAEAAVGRGATFFLTIPDGDAAEAGA